MRRVDSEPHAIRDAVRHAERFNLERSELEVGPGADDVDFRVMVDACLVKAPRISEFDFDQTGCQLGSIEGHVGEGF